MVYSYEEGFKKKPEDLNEADIEAMIDFMVKVQSIDPSNPAEIFLCDKGNHCLNGLTNGSQLITFFLVEKILQYEHEF